VPLQEKEAELLVIGADAYRAEIRGVPLQRSTVTSRVAILAKLHAGLKTCSRSPCRRSSSGGRVDSCRTEYLLPSRPCFARSSPTHAATRIRIRRALCRLLVFEAVRFGLLLRARLATNETYGVVMSDEDVDADRRE